MSMESKAVSMDAPMVRRMTLNRPSKPFSILLCLAGMSPAVVTETLYALAVTGRPQVIPCRVCIITTEDAYGKVVASLVGNKGAIHQLALEYRLPETIGCTPDDVFIIRSKSGKPLSDIRSSGDSRDAGEFIAGVLEELHSDHAVEIYCSIAGGRKTMSALLALALQTCARAGDRLYHVLINEPFERIPDFFYPPRQRILYRVDNKTVDSRKARIDLAEMPMIRLGAVAESLGLGSEQLTLRARKIEEAANQTFQPSPLEIDSENCELHFKTGRIGPPPQEFVLYALYATLRRQCTSCRKKQRPGCELCHPTDTEIFTHHRPLLQVAYAKARHGEGAKLMKLLDDKVDDAEVFHDFNKWLRETRSRIRGALRSSDMGSILGWALISDSKELAAEKGCRRGLRLQPNMIRFTNVGTSRPNVDFLAAASSPRL
jgi:CRISPR-associated protein (TIGR02584 family)